MKGAKELYITYDTFNAVRDSLDVYYVEYNNEYFLSAVSDNYHYTCKISDSAEVADFESNLKSGSIVVGSQRDAVALASKANKQNKTRPKSSDGKDIVVSWPTEGSKTTVISHNWADPTTWYSKSVRVVDETCSAQGDGYHYDMSHQHIIDLYHGKITGEDFITDSDGYSYRVEVKVNDEIQTEQDPHDGVGGDFVIDYINGEITFTVQLQESDVVKATYHYENGSEWILAPDAGKVLKVSNVEVQFSADLELTDSVLFQAYGYVDVFAPQLVNNPFPSGTKIPLGNPDVYKTMQDYINDANGAYPMIPALGGAGWRGSKNAVYTFPWQYQAVTDVFSAYGMEVRISLEHDTPFNGESAVATFYCLSIDE